MCPIFVGSQLFHFMNIEISLKLKLHNLCYHNLHCMIIFFNFYRYPLANESITTFECFAIWAVIAIVTVGIVESFSFVVFRPLEDTAVSNQQQCKIPILVLELYRIFAYFTLGKNFFNAAMCLGVKNFLEPAMFCHLAVLI